MESNLGHGIKKWASIQVGKTTRTIVNASLIGVFL
jgi:hypothetical protein